MNDESDVFLAGIEQFNQQRFFECHDLWEDLWRTHTGREKIFLQGLIQIAVGYFHAGNGKHHAALSQWTKGIEKLSPFSPQYFGIVISELIEATQHHVRSHAAMIRGESAMHPTNALPRIQLI